MKKIIELAKKNLLIMLFALFICIGVGVSAYLGLDAVGEHGWNPTIVYASTTPTPTLAPNNGWWSDIGTPPP
jgi:hypothetical protein